MIQVNEVRVGNYFMEEGIGYFQWDWKNYEDYVKDQRDGFKLDHLGVFMIVSDQIEPIPLTPEILEKAGFDYCSIFNEDGDETEFMKLGRLYYKDDQIDIGFFSEPVPHIKYLHQLQNLYFALTGEELTINL